MSVRGPNEPARRGQLARHRALPDLHRRTCHVCVRCVGDGFVEDEQKMRQMRENRLPHRRAQVSGQGVCVVCPSVMTYFLAFRLYGSCTRHFTCTVRARFHVYDVVVCSRFGINSASNVSRAA